MLATSDPSPRMPPHRSGLLRTVIEFVVCLLVLVSLFRAFEAESFVIETGSMAPCLLGAHKRAHCPACRYEFAVEDRADLRRVTCPNCDREGISVTELPHNDGDQILVQRTTFEFRPPRRWEVVIFRNPERASQAYVKRLAGKPGETVQIVAGDLFIDGQRQTKDRDTRRGMQIPVYDHDYAPEPEPGWQPRWVPDAATPVTVTPGADRPDAATGWQADRSAFRFTPPVQSAAGNPIAWVGYRHWIRHGGAHRTAAPLTTWPISVPPLDPAIDDARYDPGTAEMVCRGAMPEALRDRLLKESSDPAFRELVSRLYEASHIAPITDRCGYNQRIGGGGSNEVRDLTLSFQLQVEPGQGVSGQVEPGQKEPHQNEPGQGGAGQKEPVQFEPGQREFVAAITDGREEFEAVFDFDNRQVQLRWGPRQTVIGTARLPDVLTRPAGAVVELSLWDHQILLAVDGWLVFDPWSYPETQAAGTRPVTPVRFGARNLPVQVSHLQLFRDVFYTGGEGLTATRDPIRLRPDEYFVLGDNSPISKDSRAWRVGRTLAGDMFLGKPLLVHLPSRKLRWQIGSWHTDVRIPEFSRIRYIR